MTAVGAMDSDDAAEAVVDGSGAAVTRSVPR